MSNAEKVERLLELIGRESWAAMEANAMRKSLESAQERCHAADRKLGAMQTERDELMASLGIRTGENPIVDELIAAMTRGRTE